MAAKTVRLYMKSSQKCSVCLVIEEGLHVYEPITEVFSVMIEESVTTKYLNDPLKNGTYYGMAQFACPSVIFFTKWLITTPIFI